MSLYEKRIVPIYNAIDEENYKEAIQLCMKPDIVNIPLVLALLAFSKVSNHDIKEGIEIAKRLQQSKLTDPTVLETLAHTFRKVKAEEQVAKVYENALEIEPTNKTFLIELFFCFTRLRDHKKMQLTAQKLFKSTNKPMFLFWSVVSMQMQSDLPLTMLAVSEKMMVKMFYETDPSVQPGAEAIELFTIILKKQGKLKEALSHINDLLSRPRGPVINENDDFEMNGEMVKMHFLQTATAKYELLEELITSPINTTDSSGSETSTALVMEYRNTLISEYLAVLDQFPDQWCVHQHLVDCLLEKAMISNSIVDLLQHLKYLHSLQQKQNQLRGPYLAELYLYARVGKIQFKQLYDLFMVELPSTASVYTRIQELASDINTYRSTSLAHMSTDNAAILSNIDISELIIPTADPVLYAYLILLFSYILKFQSKPSCYSDVKPYIGSLLSPSTSTYKNDSSSRFEYIDGSDEKINDRLSPVVKALNYSNIWSNKDGRVCLSFICSMCLFGYDGLYQDILNAKAEYERYPASEATITSAATTSSSAQKSSDVESNGAVVNDISEALARTTLNTLDNDKEGEKEGENEEDESGIEITEQSSSVQSTTNISTTASASTKRNKNKKKKKKATATTSDVSSFNNTNSTARDLYRAKIVTLLCSYCKLSQIAYFAYFEAAKAQQYSVTASKITSVNADGIFNSKPISHTAVGQDDSVTFTDNEIFINHLFSPGSRLRLFLLMKGACDGGVGGDKEVQPIDELLLLEDITNRKIIENDTIERRKLATETGKTAINDDSIVVEAKYMENNIKWTANYLPGVGSSPHNYIPRIASLDLLRVNSIGLFAFEIFQKLKVRYIQTDSMMYLIIPNLLESFLIPEAIKQHRTVCFFMANASRDSSDMVVRSLKHCNYARALELERFSDKCRTSSQLLLSKSELPLLELTESKHDFESAFDFISDYMTENGFDPGTLIGRNEFDSLSHNYDFSLIFHHITSTDQEHCQLAIQKIDQILNRVYINEVVFHVLYECCRMNSIAAAEYINILGKIYEKRGVPPPPFYNDSKQVITADYNKLKSDEVINSQFQYTQWSQSINMGGYHFEYMIMSIFVGFLSWNSLVLMVFQTPSQGFAVQGQDISEVFIAVEKLQTLIIAQMATLWLDMSKERGRYAELRAKKMNRNRQTTAAGGDNELILISSDFSSATEAVDAVTAPVLNKSSSSSSSSASSSVPSDQKSSASNITGTKTGDGNAEDPEPSSNTTTELSPSDIYLKSTIEVPHVIRIASGMLRCIGTWIPLLLQPLLMHIASKSTAKSATGGAKGGSSGSSGSSSGSVMSPAIASSSSSGSGNGVVRGKTQFAGIKGCPQAWLELPIMDTDSKERVRCAELVIQFANCFIKLLEDTVILLQSIATTTHEVSIQVEADTLEPIELQEAQRTLLQHMVASHKLSAERMIATLTCKVEVLKRLIP